MLPPCNINAFLLHPANVSRSYPPVSLLFNNDDGALLKFIEFPLIVRYLFEPIVKVALETLSRALRSGSSLFCILGQNVVSNAFFSCSKNKACTYLEFKKALLLTFVY